MRKVDTNFIDEITTKRHKSVFDAYINTPSESLRTLLRYYDSVSALMANYLDQINEIEHLKKKISFLENSLYKGE